MPMNMVYTPQPSYNRDQDNTRVAVHAVAYEVSGYRKISHLPEFKNLTYQEYIKNTPAKIDLKKLEKMGIEDMRILFEGIGFDRFVAVFNKESKSPVEKEYPYAVDINKPDFRSPNLKKIDSEILRLTEEIEEIEAFNARTKDDRTAPHAKKWALIVSPQVSMGVKFITDGTDNHSFDTNSPELIQQAIDDGRIKPFVKIEKIDI